jgi:hypothetical protein
VSDETPKAPAKNWVPQILLCAGVCVWQIYELTAPGEAQSRALIALELFLLVCGLIGFFGGLMLHFKGR